MRAQEVAQALTEVFLDSNLGHSREQMEAAQEFLDRQIAVYERQLEEAENRLASFKRDRLSTLPEPTDYHFEIEQLRDELAAAEAGLRGRRRNRRACAGSSTPAPSPTPRCRSSRPSRLLEDLSTRYTDRHPDVVASRRKLATLRGAGALDDWRSAPSNAAPAPGRR